MSQPEYTEQDYYEQIRVYLEDGDEDGDGLFPLIDKVATPTEWLTFRAALTRWIAEKDAEYIDLIDNPEP